MNLDSLDATAVTTPREPSPSPSSETSTRPQPKMAEELAVKLESLIMERGWPVGEIVGSEPELIARLGVSRAVFREAVRIIEHHGVARMRRGPGGGLIVTAPDLRAVQRPAMLYLDYANVSTEDLLAVRSTLELACVEQLAPKIDEAGAARLREQLAREVSEGVEGIQTGTIHDLHVLIAQLTGNAALHLFVKTLAQLTFERVHDQSYDSSDTAETNRAHTAIVEAIIAGDVSLAQHRMRRHLAAATSYYARRS